MAEADYLLAALPDRHIILGQLLRPLSLGHIMILRRMGNAFVCGGESPGVTDLLQGVFVCSQSYEEAQESLQSDELSETLRKWAESLGEFDLRAKMASFLDYVQKACTWPELLEMDGKETRTPGACMLQRLKLILISRLNHTESEALNKPFGLAVYDCFGFLELDGKAKIANEDDAEVGDEHARLLREYDEQLVALAKDLGRQ